MPSCSSKKTGDGGDDQADQTGESGTARLPLDYYFWQNGALCAGTETQEFCSPAPPLPLQSEEEIIAFEDLGVRQEYRRLPSDEWWLRDFLMEADREGKITWGGIGSPNIYEVLQQEIDTAFPGQDVHFVFGFAHRVEGQTAFFNELLTEGMDDYMLRGVTHLVFENARLSASGADIQRNIDQFMLTGIMSYLPMISVRIRRGVDDPDTVRNEVSTRYRTFLIARDEGINPVAADLPVGDSAELQDAMGYYYWLAAREIFAVQSVDLRQDPVGQDVVFWRWGASHAEKNRLPYIIGIFDPFAKVVSVVINGGTYVDAMAFDRVLESLGWSEEAFILKLDGYREADYIIHVPIEGRYKMEGISSYSNPVVQHIFNPPYE